MEYPTILRCCLSVDQDAHERVAKPDRRRAQAGAQDTAASFTRCRPLHRCWGTSRGTWTIRGHSRPGAVLDDRTSSIAGGSPQVASDRVEVDLLFCVHQNHDDDAWTLKAQRRGPVSLPREAGVAQRGTCAFGASLERARMPGP